MDISAIGSNDFSGQSSFIDQVSEDADNSCVVSSDALFEAMHCKDLVKLRDFLAYPVVDLSGRNGQGQTLLHVAVVSRNHEMVEVLVNSEHPLNFEAVDNGGLTALALVVINECVDMVHLLVRAGAKVNGVSSNGLTPLYFAVLSNHTSMVNALLAVDANVNKVANNGGDTVLMIAASLGNLDISRALLAKGANINIADKRRKNLLMWAAQSVKDEAVMTMLLKAFRKACGNIDAIVNDGRTALMAAVGWANVGAVNALLKAGANVHVANYAGDTVLIIAANGGNLDIIRALLAKGVHINTANKRGITPLMKAVEGNHVTVVDLLLEAGANVHAADVTGDNVLMFAARRGNLGIIGALLAKGANINTTNAFGVTPLMCGIRFAWDGVSGDKAVMAMLLDALRKVSGDIDAVENDGRTALMMATERWDVVAVNALLEAGANIHAKDNDGMSPLYCLGKRLVSMDMEAARATGNGHTPTSLMTAFQEPFGARETEIRVEALVRERITQLAC